jgi:hypothetical protein
VHDYARLAGSDFGANLSKMTANTVLATDRRFCWSGPGLYGLYRHGPLPGPRNLEQACRAVLVATGPLHFDVVEYLLKANGYRFATGSLHNAVSRSADIGWNDGWWSCARGEEARRRLRLDLQAAPPRLGSGFVEFLDSIARTAPNLYRARERKLARLPTTVAGVVGVDWADEVSASRRSAMT